MSRIRPTVKVRSFGDKRADESPITTDAKDYYKAHVSKLNPSVPVSLPQRGGAIVFSDAKPFILL